jgi:prepilin-type N-terminal cleavage/methylation domain-containing protein
MMLNSLKNRTKGFTLIELLVVIAIIGILSSVVLASLATARAKSRDAKRVSDIGQIQLGLELQFDANQSYPQTNQVAGSASADGGVQLLVNNGFIPTLPVPPPGLVSKYQYRGLLAATLPAVAGQECSAVNAVCIFYFLGALLERTDSTVLQNDADASLVAVTGPYALTGAAAAIGGPMTGLGWPTVAGRGCGYTVAADVGTAQPGGQELCYDIHP